MRRVIVSLLAVLLAGVGQVSGQGNGRIEGTVKSTDNRPIVNARVFIVGETGSTGTNAQGHYALASVPSGTTSIRVNATGFIPFEVTGVRVLAGQTLTQDFRLEPRTPPDVGIATNAFENASITVPMSVLLRFQLLRPVSTRTTDKAIMPIDSVLRDLFQWPGYELLAQAAIMADLPRTSAGRVMTQQSFNADGETYTLRVLVDSTLRQRVRLNVNLSGIVSLPGPLSTGSQGRGTLTQRTDLLSTTVTVGFGHTVVLGSTQPGGGRGGMNGTLILTVRPEPRTGNDQ